jgi:Pyruvate/2-oxoacid:ferredoxin oxidoreductase gamma subunit
MIGTLAATERLPVKVDALKAALRELVPAKYLDTNIKAFELGYNAVEAHGHRFK